MDWVAIDFGTCNSAAAICIDGKPVLVPSTYESNVFPTEACVLPDADKTILVCNDARAYLEVHPERYFSEFKLDLGGNFQVDGIDYLRVTTEILKKIRNAAINANNNQNITKALLTIPALYTEADARKSIMEQAARSAGFQEVKFLPEPNAAAYHYSYIQGSLNSDSIFLIYDLGGSTFDPALIQNNKFLGKSKGTECGGHYFDSDIYQYAKKKITSALGEKEEIASLFSRKDKRIDSQKCKKLKESLSTSEIGVATFSNGKNFKLRREEFEELIEPRIKETLSYCDSLVRSSGKGWRDIDQILLVGGSTSIPLIHALLKSYLQSHNAGMVAIINNTICPNGKFNSLFAVCLGGIVYAENLLSTASESKKETIAVIRRISDGKEFPIEEGSTTFGRFEHSYPMDKAMSREHFSIEASLNLRTKSWEYMIMSISEKKDTIVDQMSLNLQYSFAPKNVFLKGGEKIIAGNTKFEFIIKEKEL